MTNDQIDLLARAYEIILSWPDKEPASLSDLGPDESKADETSAVEADAQYIILP